MCVPNPLLLREKLGMGSSLLVVGHCIGVGLWLECVSASLSNLLQRGYYLIFPACRGSSASFWISLGEFLMV